MLLLSRITECNPEVPPKKLLAILIKINLILKLGIINLQRIIMARPKKSFTREKDYNNYIVIKIKADES